MAVIISRRSSCRPNFATAPFVLLCTQRDAHPLYNKKRQLPCVADKKETPTVFTPLREFREAHPPKIEVATSINLIIFVTN